MGRAKLRSGDFPDGPADGRGVLTAQGHEWAFQHVSIGNPQCAIRIDSLEQLEALDLGAIGPPIEGDRRFPNRTNVSWYTRIDDGRIRARIFERGVGETLSSGTGATGAAVAYLQEEGPRRAGPRVAVLLDGGELEVEVGEDLRIKLTGWARPVFEARLSEEFEKELHETE
jgi:diaminopimelate epimerase